MSSLSFVTDSMQWSHPQSSSCCNSTPVYHVTCRSLLDRLADFLYLNAKLRRALFVLVFTLNVAVTTRYTFLLKSSASFKGHVNPFHYFGSIQVFVYMKHAVKHHYIIHSRHSISGLSTSLG